MSKKIVIAALGAVVAMGIGSGTLADQMSDSMKMQKETSDTLNKAMPGGFEKCYGIAKAGKNDCASKTEACAGQAKADGAKDAWLGVPKGTCNKIVGGSTTEG
ncbi:hypothetical protein AQUSIP_09440 [Aquicella siphonis]|uniref:Uncharacterized protein n=1 Tax=Aquicella siphonis TaxID=254247 RepID=A0A5E4PFN7_9COXI|nr:DUF2282 domain-containing protein [Aquicella siphonis]VVC75654.1 hypothetical protein AQUSIP_09440 [Aquicella siphonis]